MGFRIVLPADTAGKRQDSGFDNKSKPLVWHQEKLDLAPKLLSTVTEYIGTAGSVTMKVFGLWYYGGMTVGIYV